MLVCCWSPKGGSGTSVFAAACALTLARGIEGVRLAGFIRHDVYLLDGIGGAIEIEVKPHVEKVLMVRGV